MNLPRIFANAFARKIAAVVVVAVFAWMGIGQARARTYDQGSAWAACTAQAAHSFYGGNAGCYDMTASKAVALQSKPVGPGGWTYQIFNYAGTCLSRTGDGDGGGPKNAIAVGSPPCINGCAYANTNGTFSTRFDFGTGQSVDFYSAQGMQPTGAVCGGTPPPPPPTCKPDGTIKQCVKDDGRHCVVASNGTTMCWQPGETGTKVSGNVAVTKAPANVAIKPPSTPPKNNGDWELQSTTTTKVTNNSGAGAGATNNYNNGTYISNYGTEGNGGGAEGDGDGEGEGDGHGTVGGDGSCEGSFTCSGGDPVLCAAAQQAYAARCEAKDRTDGDAGPFPGDGDGGAGEDPDAEGTYKSVTMGLGLLDEGGLLGGGTCPDLGTFTVMGKTIALDEMDHFCQIIAVARTCILLLGAFIAIGILVGRSE